MKPANFLRRRLLQSLSAVPWLTACQSNAIERAASPDSLAQRMRFNGIALRLIVDAVPDAKMQGVEFFADEWVRPIYHSSSVSQRVRSLYDFGNPIPLKVRVVWRKERIGAQLSWGNMASYDDFGVYLGRPGVYIESLTGETKQIAKRQIVSKNTGVPHYGPWGSDYRGELAGDFTLEVASRIPDEVLHDIRKQGGGIRLKFRLKHGDYGRAKVACAWMVDQAKAAGVAMAEPDRTLIASPVLHDKSDNQYRTAGVCLTRAHGCSEPCW